MSTFQDETPQFDRNSIRSRTVSARALPAVDERLYVVPSGRIGVVHSISVSNGSASRRTFRLHVVTPAESSGIGNSLFYDCPLAAGGALRDLTERRLMPGDSIRGMASAADSVSVSVHVTEMAVP